MTQRAATAWQSNPAKRTGVAYSSSAVTYSSAATSYSTPDAAVDSFGRSASSWSKPSGLEAATVWIANLGANANYYTFDSATIPYDSASRTYDGLVTTDFSDNDKLPTAWSSL